MAAQFTATNGCSARALRRCTLRAITSLPTPVSPCSSTETLPRAALSMVWQMRW